jgi:predicted alpha-1,2-mannosidase
MKILRYKISLLEILLTLFFGQFIPVPLSAQIKQPIDYVNPFIGTSNSRWMLGPYAQLPFGMVQLGPDNQGSVWMGGYEYALNVVSGFSHIHAWTMAGLEMMPATSDFTFESKGPDYPYLGAQAGYHSRIQKETEKASPGYYSVFLYDHKVQADITVTRRCGFQRYTFPECSESRIMIDMVFPAEYGMRPDSISITRTSDTEITGYCQYNTAGFNDYKFNFVIQFSKPFRQMNSWENGRIEKNIDKLFVKPNLQKGIKNAGVFVTYNTKDKDEVLIRTGISLVSIDQARLNLETEFKEIGWDFDKAVRQAKETWNALLGRIEVEGNNETDKIKFYTNLYRAYCGKQVWSDVNGKWVDPCENVQQLPSAGMEMYGGDAFWNTFWNLNLTWTLISPNIVNNWVTTQLELFDKTGWTCKGSTGLEYSGVMEGSHEIALMVAAYQKGIRNYDSQKLYAAVKHQLTTPGRVHECSIGGYVGQKELEAYNKFGYMPSEKGSICMGLEYAYDDWTGAQLAKAFNEKDDYNFLLKRSGSWKNAFRPDIKWVSPRDSLGKWKENFNIFSGEGFIEGNSWQYSWYVPHDVPGLIHFLGKDIFNNRLEEGFEKAKKFDFNAYAFDRYQPQVLKFYVNHGNEPNMQASFLFNYSGKPWLTQKWSRAILDQFYGHTPYEGWKGDEDEGQMSAWFVNTSMGLFEMDGGCTSEPMVDLTSPLFNKVVIHLDNKYYKGKSFIIKANNNSKENIYIQSATLNGKKLNIPKIKFSDISNGGELILEMGPKPNENWGIGL